MLRSMTAYAGKSLEVNGVTVNWELRSVNHRYLDLSLKLPEAFRFVESAARDLLSAALKRGKVECVLTYRQSEAVEEGFVVNTEKVRQLLLAASEVSGLMEHPGTFTSLDILRWPGVLEERHTDFEELLPALMSLLSDTLGDLIAHREREGEKLADAVSQRCENIAQLATKARARLPVIREGLRGKLHNRLNELELHQQPDTSRFEQELVYLLHKLDVDEELDRLDVHLEEIRRALSQKGPIGRRLDFLMQELNREANTLGSKATESDMSGISVDIKVLIEQMREQIQNIE